jgi:hypothetical protein
VQFSQFHSLSRHLCVNVCVCVWGGGWSWCSLLRGSTYDGAMLLNSSVLTILGCQPSLKGCLERSRICLDVVTGSFKAVLQ